MPIERLMIVCRTLPRASRSTAGHRDHQEKQEKGDPKGFGKGHCTFECRLLALSVRPYWVTTTVDMRVRLKDYNCAATR
jgi:hypothetical protein